jgi:CBS domain-containing protein
MIRSDAVRCVLRQKGREVFSVTPATSVYDALAVMAEKGVGALLVMEEGCLLGLISERDYARKVILQGRSSRETEVREIMSEDLLTVTPEHTIDECMQLMTERRVRHLPVIDRGQVGGIVSMGDLVKYTISAQMQEIKHLHAYITGGYNA